MKNKLDWDLLTKKLIDHPFTLLSNKLDYIIETCKDHKVKNLLEVGSFAGGSAYALGKALPNTNIKSIDINNFTTFFSTTQNDNILECIHNYFLNLKPKHLRKIQKFYNLQLPNIKIETAILQNLDISNYDAIILDGDHHIEGIKADLKYVLENNKSCIIFVDDTSVKHIKDEVEHVCGNKSYNLNLEYVYRNNDLAILTRIKK